MASASADGEQVNGTLVGRATNPTECDPILLTRSFALTIMGSLFKDTHIHMCIQ